MSHRVRIAVTRLIAREGGLQYVRRSDDELVIELGDGEHIARLTVADEHGELLSIPFAVQEDAGWIRDLAELWHGSFAAGPPLADVDEEDDEPDELDGELAELAELPSVPPSGLCDLVGPGEPQCGATPRGRSWPVCARPPEGHAGKYGRHESANFAWNDSGWFAFITGS